MRALAPALLGLSLLVPSAAAGETVRRLALLVSHPVGGPDTQPLLYAERDAMKMAAVLTELGGFRPEDVTRLDAPTADGVSSALAALEGRVRAARARGERPLLLFYYSGHAAAGELRLGATRLPLKQLRAALQGSTAEIRIAFFDACQSGAITRLKGGRRGPAFVVDVEPGRRSEGMVLITSSSAHESSQESDELRGSFFTHHLVSGLRGAADRSGDASVSLSEAYAYAYHQTVAHTAGTRGGTQHPTYTYALEGNGAVVLTRLGGRGALLFGAGGAGGYLVYDRGRDVVVGEVHKAAGQSLRLSVPLGRYVIKKRARDHLLLQDVEVSANQQRLVEEAAFERVPFEADVTKGPAWLEARHARRRTWVINARAGYQAFFDAPSREALFHPSPMFGVQAEWLNALAPRISLGVDAAFGGTRAEVQAGIYREVHPVEFSMLVAGLGLDFDWWLGPARLHMGPRLGALYARRRFLDDVVAFQDLFTISPGLAAGADWRLGGFALGIDLRSHYLRYSTEREDRSLGFGEAYISLGYAP